MIKKVLFYGGGTWLAMEIFFLIIAIFLGEKYGIF